MCRTMMEESLQELVMLVIKKTTAHRQIRLLELEQRAICLAIPYCLTYHVGTLLRVTLIMVTNLYLLLVLFLYINIKACAGDKFPGNSDVSEISKHIVPEKKIRNFFQTA